MFQSSMRYLALASTCTTAQRIHFTLPNIQGQLLCVFLARRATQVSRAQQ
jgi:hypothetical protein